MRSFSSFRRRAISRYEGILVRVSRWGVGRDGVVRGTWGSGGVGGLDDVLQRLKTSGKEVLFFTTFLIDAQASLSELLRECTGDEWEVAMCCAGAPMGPPILSLFSLEDLASELLLRPKPNDVLCPRSFISRVSEEGKVLLSKILVITSNVRCTEKLDECIAASE